MVNVQKFVGVNISTFTVSRRMCPAITAQSIEDSERDVGVRSGQVRSGQRLMRSSRPGGPRAGTRPKAKPRAESRPEGPLDVMNACSTMEI